MRYHQYPQPQQNQLGYPTQLAWQNMMTSFQNFGLENAEEQQINLFQK